jgi:hypothetical protein
MPPGRPALCPTACSKMHDIKLTGEELIRQQEDSTYTPDSPITRKVCNAVYRLDIDETVLPWGAKAPPSSGLAQGLSRFGGPELPHLGSARAFHSPAAYLQSLPITQ